MKGSRSKKRSPKRNVSGQRSGSPDLSPGFLSPQLYEDDTPSISSTSSGLSMSMGRSKKGSRLSPDRVAAERTRNSTEETYESIDETIVRFNKQQSQREKRKTTICNRIEELYDMLQQLDSLTPAQRSQAAEAREDIIQEVEGIAHDALTTQVAEIKHRAQCLDAISEASTPRETGGSGLKNKVLHDTPLAALVPGEKEKSKKSEQKKPHRKKRRAPGAAGEDSAEDNYSEDSATGEGSSGGGSHSPAGTLPHNIESEDGESGSSIDMDMEDREGQEVGDQAQDDLEKFIEQQGDGSDGSPGRRADSSGDENRSDPSAWSHKAELARTENPYADSAEEYSDGGDVLYESDDLVDDTAQGKGFSWDSPGPSPKSSIEGWVEDQACRLAEESMAFPPSPDMQRIQPSSPPLGRRMFRDTEHGRPGSFSVDHHGVSIPPLVDRAASTDTRLGSRARRFSTRGAFSPDPGPSSNEAAVYSHLAIREDGDLSHYTVQAPKRCRSVRPKPLGDQESKGRRKSNEVKPEWSQTLSGSKRNGKKSRGNSDTTMKGRATSIRDEHRPGLIPEQDKDGQNAERTQAPDDPPVTKSLVPTAAVMKSHALTQPQARRSWQLRTSIAKSLPSPAIVSGGLGSFVRTQYTAWIDLLWFVVTWSHRELYDLLHLVFDPVQSTCARFEHWIEYPLAQKTVVPVRRESGMALAAQACLFGIFLVVQVYIALQRERGIWLEANGLTRTYMLDYVHEDPSWGWLPGVDPKLMLGFGEAVSFARGRMG